MSLTRELIEKDSSITGELDKLSSEDRELCIQDLLRYGQMQIYCGRRLPPEKWFYEYGESDIGPDGPTAEQKKRAEQIFKEIKSKCL